MREDPAMTVIPMVTRRLLRTKPAAAYLSMSEWKLRRLIQTEILAEVSEDSQFDENEDLDEVR